jgi:pimeloyl-ACP methyl ester carboxylesterase
VTIFAFAGLAVKYGGIPIFEFRRILQYSGLDCNLVFLRDIHRLSYHVTPGGEKGGLEFFERQIIRIRESLGSTHNVGLGVSMGGSAAFYFATRCKLEQIIAFSPGIPYTEYCSFQNQIRTYLDIARLIRSPSAYIELVLVTAGMAWSYRRLRRAVGPTKIWSILDSYRACRPRPRATVFYGTGCRPDKRQGKFLNFPEIKRVPLPTPYHSCTEFLKKRGELGSTIAQEIKWYQKNFNLCSDT